MTSTTSKPLLKVAGLSSGYGRVSVLEGVNLEVEPQEIVIILGPHGAGKTTLLNSISGVARVTAGSIEFQRRAITGTRPEHVVRMGLVHCPEGRKIFQRLTVEGNLLAAHARRSNKSFEALRDDVFALFPILFTGLAAALGARDCRLRVGLLEGNEVGSAASARNNGLLISHHSKAAPSEFEAAFGRETGQRFNAMVAAAGDVAFGLMRCFGIDARQQQNGWPHPRPPVLRGGSAVGVPRMATGGSP